MRMNQISKKLHLQLHSRQFILIVMLLLSFQISKGANFEVNRLDGNDATATANNGSFRGAIMAVNAAAAGIVHTISFNSLPAPYTINCTGMAATTTITRRVLIQGNAHPNWSCGNPVVVLNGAGALNTLVLSDNIGGGVNALIFQNVQLQILNGSANTVYGCFFGTNSTGTAVSNYSFTSTYQLQITTSASNIIGGTTCAKRNVFAGANTAYVINNTSSSSTIIRGNYIGTDKTGTLLLNANTQSGIRLESICNSITIDSNIIVGNGTHGIETYSATLTHTTDNLTIRYNKIGLNSTELKAAVNFGNKLCGIYLSRNATTVLITTNRICDNGTLAGCTNTSSGIYTAARMTTMIISKNYIGIDSNFTLAGNFFAGINIDGTVSVAAAGSSGITVTGNYVGDNGKCTNRSHGIAFAQIGSAGTPANITVQGNYVGVSPTGADMGNYHTGIEFYQINGFLCGGTTAAQRNYVGFNKGMNTNFANGGIMLVYQCNNGNVYGNYIGLAPNGTGNAGNIPLGVRTDCGAGINIEDACTNINIGGSAAGQGNMIYNNKFGIKYGGPVTTFNTNTRVRGNTIASNSSHGMLVGNGNHHYIGGTLAGEANIISNNGGNGISVTVADYVQMRKNSIYCNTLKGINLNLSGTPGNNSFAAPTINPGTSAPTATFTTQVNGTTNSNNVVEIFTTMTCAVACATNPQGETLRGTVTAGAVNYSFNNGSALFGYLSATATTPGCLNSILVTDNCRTSEFSTCFLNSLPVEFLSFNARTIDDRKVELSWKTAMELNNDYFIVERSVDGLTFEEAGKVKGTGNSNNHIAYRYNDQIKGDHNKFYYRIKQIDVDGKFSHSNVESVVFDLSNIFTVYPNPNAGEFTIGGYSESEGLVSIYDPYGKIIWETLVPAVNNRIEQPINFQGMKQGIYYTRIQTAAGASILKVLIE
jgi:hypothetical protein